MSSDPSLERAKERLRRLEAEEAEAKQKAKRIKVKKVEETAKTQKEDLLEYIESELEDLKNSENLISLIPESLKLADHVILEITKSTDGKIKFMLYPVSKTIFTEKSILFECLNITKKENETED